MSWRLANSLEKLRQQINMAYPNRDKSSDGSIGDTSHAARKSDHNPNAAGVVTAIDIDEDVDNSGGKTMQLIVDSICASKDPRVKYIIYEGRITVKGSNLQEWKKYTGVNAHRHHAHISVSVDAKLYDDTSDWNINTVSVVAKRTGGQPQTQNYIVRSGDTLWGIARQFATSVQEIKRLNGLKSDTIRTEQRLRIK